MKKPNKILKIAVSRSLVIIILCSIIGALVGSVTTYSLMRSQNPSKEDLIRDYYLTENAVHVSPHTVRKKMDQGVSDFILVDLRSSLEYEKEHVIGAINIPTYKDPNTSISVDTEREEKDRIIQQFRALSKEKDIIVYCYSMPCMTGRKIGKLLAENGIFVKHLNIGWNEWRYFWNLWNHDSETLTEGKDYIVSGKDPGKPKIKDTLTPCRVGELGC
ncbi:rhodanese-like domain-containing protein [Candidatus Gottesmanbacteria bacterium]|nr:rhodanese-like domain-containing protein [Candidatus Gottesmanbacteria bacterium]